MKVAPPDAESYDEDVEIVAHSLWAAAGLVAAKRARIARVRTGCTIWWSAFPDLMAFGPMFIAGVWLRLAGDASAEGNLLPHGHIGVPLYPAAHSLIVFAAVFGATTILARRIVYELFGWLLHIVIDIPTHSYAYYATRFLWPASDLRLDGIAWWTPWFWVLTYAGLAVVYLVMWRKRWLHPPQPASEEAPVNRGLAASGDDKVDRTAPL